MDDLQQPFVNVESFSSELLNDFFRTSVDVLQGYRLFTALFTLFLKEIMKENLEYHNTSIFLIFDVDFVHICGTSKLLKYLTNRLSEKAGAYGLEAQRPW
ncbi:hypothetical protein DPMN_049898 [Dreissena polymorpha]|uniref:Uncharacterized protein n=1 Tax=Dreissena polymorpha TaxID=45954 RepID=A0A9D4CG74_DREPO|nr:hypothetical protein DPMN_049898 [Dreissena polymorpha]